MPSLNALRAFEATARHGSYEKASRELCVTPAAVKQLVTKLEDAVSLKLLTYTGRRMAVTREGLRGLESLSLGFRQIRHGVDQIRAAKAERRLVISVEPSFAAAWLVPRLEDFKAAHRDVDVLIDSSMQVVDLARGDADIGIRYGVTEHRHLVVHRLFEEELCALCSPPRAIGPPPLTRLKDLETATLIRWDLSQFEWATNTRHWNRWRTWLEAVGGTDVMPGCSLSFSDYNLAVQAAIAGQGFILGSRPVLRGLLDANLLVDPFSLSARPGVGYDVVATKDALDRDEIKAFLHWIVDSAAN